MAGKASQQRRIVSLAKLRLFGIQGLLNRLHLSLLLRRRHKGPELVGKGHQASFILLIDCDVREHQGRIDGIIQECHLLKGLLHHTSFVNDRENLLRAFVLIDIDHQLMTTGRGTPVDSTVVITHDIVLNLFKVGVITYTTDTLDSHLRKVIAHSQQFILAKHHIRRIDLNVLRFTTGIAALY